MSFDVVALFLLSVITLTRPAGQSPTAPPWLTAVLQGGKTKRPSLVVSVRFHTTLQR